MNRWIGVLGVVTMLGQPACAAATPPATPTARSPQAAIEWADRLEVAHFATDDPRVGTAGFVGQTTRISQVDGATTFTLMAFAVGDVLTLGAMVEGAFAGTAKWEVGGRIFSVAVDRSNRGRLDVPVHGLAVTGQHGGFEEFDWVNIDLQASEWLPEGTRVRLTFTGAGRTVALPSSERWYRAVLSPR